MQKTFLYISSLFIILLIPFQNTIADSGISFRSGEVAKENRTGIDFTHEDRIKYNEKIIIDFNFSLRKTETHYGDILTLWENESHNSIEIRYRTPDLYIIQNETLSKIHLDLDKLEIPFNRWLHMHLEVDTKEGNIYFSLGDHEYKSTINFASNSAFDFTMGAISKDHFRIDEVPSISIKDVNIVTDRDAYYWPLQKTSDNLVKDKISNHKALINNPNWVTDHHNHWQKLKTIDVPFLPTITFDNKKELISFTNFDGSILVYNLHTDDITHCSAKNYPAFEKSQQAIINADGAITSYSFSNPQTSTYDAENNTWSQSSPSKIRKAPLYWHHNKLIHPNTQEITTLCGYGFYTYFNTIQSFNNDTQEWHKLDFEGDKIPPRYMAALGGSSTAENVYYLFGGMGNEQGKQILGHKFYYDLYKIDFGTNSITKLWETYNNEQLLPVNSLKMSDNDSSFYTLMFSSKKENTTLQVVKGNISNSNLIFIGDSIPYNFTDVSSFADLYYWENENKLIALTMQSINDYENYKIELYTIDYEPALPELAIERKDVSPYIIFLIGLLVLTGLILFFLRRRKKQQNMLTVEIERSTKNNTPELIIPKCNTILLFGGFQAFDKDGRNITYRFSPIVKELFLLILFSSVNNQKGISSRRLQESLWPDKTQLSAKNNRGVNIKKLRTILEDIEGLEIIFDKNYWTTHISDGLFCDLDELYKHISNTGNKTDEVEINKITSLLKAGAVMRDISAYWLDPFKDKTTEDAVSYLENLLEKEHLSKGLQMKVAESITGFDEMNVLALKTKCNLLIAQGKKGLALKSYEHFQKAHLKFYNEEFNTDFKTLTRK